MSFVAKTKSSAEWKLITNVVSTIVEEPSFEANAEEIGSVFPSQAGTLPMTRLQDCCIIGREAGYCAGGL